MLIVNFSEEDDEDDVGMEIPPKVDQHHDMDIPLESRLEYEDVQILAPVAPPCPPQ